MILLDLFPAGVLQLQDALANGYWHSRRLGYTMAGAFHALEWIRFAGDMTFLLAGALPITVAAFRMIFGKEPGRKVA
jgi:nitric oxide reductase subunit B